MWTTVTIRQQTKDKLCQREYMFLLMDEKNRMEFVLNKYTKTRRRTTRHGFVMTEIYNRIRTGSTYMGVMECIEPPVIPKRVLARFYEKARSLVTLKGYEENDT